LLEREQARLLDHLCIYVQELRNVICGSGKPAFESIHAAFQTVAREVEAFMAELFRQKNAAAVSERALNVQNRQELLQGLEEVIRGLVADLDRWVRFREEGSLIDSFVESIDALLMTARDAADSSRLEDAELLVHLTRDRSEILRALRQGYLAQESNLTSEGRQLFLRITGHFETAVWILGRMAQLKRQDLLADRQLRS
jgi:hypothetical protein